MTTHDRLVVEKFSQPVYVAWYLFALVPLAYHLSHGFTSALRTLGFDHPRWLPKVKAIGYVYAGLVMLGFMSQPLYVYFFHHANG